MHILWPIFCLEGTAGFCTSMCNNLIVFSCLNRYYVAGSTYKQISDIIRRAIYEQGHLCPHQVWALHVQKPGSCGMKCLPNRSANGGATAVARRWKVE